jgi:hypothetical protein
MREHVPIRLVLMLYIKNNKTKECPSAGAATLGDKMKNIKCIVITFLLVYSAATPAYADMGIPMLAWAWPWMIISLIPIIMIESLYIRRSLKLSFGRALKVMSIANIESTLIGVPITWVAWVIIEIILGYMGTLVFENFHVSLPESASLLLALTVGAAWFTGAQSNLYWMVPTASLVLLIPFFYVSWLFERRRTKRLLREYDPVNIKKATFIANLCSYGLLFAIVLGWLIYSIAKKAVLNKGIEATGKRICGFCNSGCPCASHKSLYFLSFRNHQGWRLAHFADK